MTAKLTASSSNDGALDRSSSSFGTSSKTPGGAPPSPGGVGGTCDDDNNNVGGVSIFSIMVGQQEDQEQEVTVIAAADFGMEEGGGSPPSALIPIPDAPDTSSTRSSPLPPPTVLAEPATTIPQRTGEEGEVEEDQQNRGFQHRQVHRNPISRWAHRFSTKRPRICAICIGVIFPLASLIMMAIVCGYPLALIESPIELDTNDETLEQQLRLFVEASLYTNITQNLPRICLALYFTNSTVDEFLENVTKLIAGPPKLEQYHHIVRDSTEQLLEEGEGDYLTFEEWSNATTTAYYEEGGGNYTDHNSTNSSFSNATTFQEIREAREPWREVELVTPLVMSGGVLGIEIPTYQNEDGSYENAVNVTDLTDFVVDCGQGLSPMIDKMFLTLTKTARFALEDGLSFAWSVCPANQTTGWAGHKFYSSDQQQLSKEEETEEGEEEETLLPKQKQAPPAPFLWDFFFSASAPQGWENTYDYLNSDSQTAFYRQRWEMDRRRLYNQYLKNQTVLATNEELKSLGINLEFMLGIYKSNNNINETNGFDNNGNTTTNSTEPTFAQKVYAYEMSLQQASGREGCVPHVPAACWFWFTVMTTIGYGNASPSTQAGRLMVFTIGFVSILIFGGVSARAAYVITSLFEDTSIRLGFAKYVSKFGGVVLWGIIYYTWMFVIARHYVWWQQDRLGEATSVDDIETGYWFAYISTTTVGFGDYYLEPEVFRFSDLAVFPMMFLVGFSFLAAFLTKLTDCVRKPFTDGETLVARFKKADEAAAAERKSKTAATSSSDLD